MRKTQVALAALAMMASTVALATEVTLTGQIDIGVVHTGKDADGKGGTFMEQGGLLDHSSITISAKEDIGNGLKAFVVLESGFNANGYADNGGVANNATSGATALFSRQSFVGLSSDQLGTVGLGKQLSPFILSQALTNFGVGSFWVNRLMVGNGSTAGGAFAAGGNGLNSVGFFIPNSVTYTSPSIAGFTVSALTAAATGTQNNTLQNDDAANPATATSSSNRYDSVSLSGNIGAAFLSAAWQERKDAYSSWTVGGTYGVIDGLAVMANYMEDKDKVANTSVKSWAVGGKYTLVAGTDAILQYAENDADAKMKLTNLTLVHSLSKRTSVYATAAHGTNVGSSIGNFKSSFDTGASNSSYGVGVAHSF